MRNYVNKDGNMYDGCGCSLIVDMPNIFELAYETESSS